MLAPDWTWWDALPIALAAVALLWIPGGLLARGLGAERWASVALAPVLTAALVSVFGIIVALVGLPWNLATLLVVTLVLPGLVLGGRLLLERGQRSLPRLNGPQVSVGEVAIGLLVSAGILTYAYVRASHGPGAVPQQPDAIYHLGLVRYFLDNGDISSLTADAFNKQGVPAFYPAALHGVAASLALLTSAPVPVVLNMTLMVTAVLAWPLGLMFFMSALLPQLRYGVLASGVLGAVFPLFPTLLLVYGPVWPLSFGNAFVLPVVAVFGLGLRQGFAGKNFVVAALLFVVGVAGMSLGHTSSTFAAVPACFLLAVLAAWRFAREPGRTGAVRWTPLAAVLVLGAAAFAAATAVAPQGLVETSYARSHLRRAVIDAFTLWARQEDLFQVTGGVLLLVTLTGMVLALRRRDQWWLALTWAYFWVLGVITSYFPASQSWPFTWPWYNVAVRVQAIVGVYGVPLVAIAVTTVLGAAAGVGAAAGAASGAPDGSRRSRGSRLFRQVLTVVVAALVLALVAIQAQQDYLVLRPYYQIRGNLARVFPEEVKALEALSAVLPDDAVVATNPWRGSQFLYIVGPETTVIHTEKSDGPDLTTIGAGLDHVLVDKSVCAAVERQRVTYVITGGHVQGNAAGRDRAYAGMEDVSQAEGFVVVDKEGTYTLWKVPACQP